MTMPGWLKMGVMAVVIAVIYHWTRPYVRVMTQCGVVEGLYDRSSGVSVFKSIPYALPPVGKLRWRPPVPLHKDDQTCSGDVYIAHEHKQQCAQFDPVTQAFAGGEDCLYLDIFTPTTDSSALLPVMFHIHGGGLIVFNASFDGYAPNVDITAELNVVFVSVEYRLNGFGFLVLDILEGRSGNYGILDQIEALRWVQNNIINFGGDPNKVTVFGQSSGGTSIMALMLSTLTKGLFHQAWISSGSSVLMNTKEDAAKQNLFFLNKTGCYSDTCLTDECLLHCISELSAEEVVHGVMPEWEFDIGSLPIKDVFAKPVLVIDGEVVSSSPLDAWQGSGSHNDALPDVPLIIGTTAQEVDYAPTPKNIYSWSEEYYNKYILDKLQEFGKDVAKKALELYPFIDNGEFSYTTICSDVLMNCGNDVIASAMASTLRGPVYRYVTTAYPSSANHAFYIPIAANYSYHSYDFFAFFRHMEVFFKEPPTVKDHEFANNMVENIGHFVKHGVPRDDQWLPYPACTALIGETVSTIPHKFHEEQCRFWNDNGFYRYSWMN